MVSGRVAGERVAGEGGREEGEAGGGIIEQLVLPSAGVSVTRFYLQYVLCTRFDSYVQLCTSIYMGVMYNYIHR